MTAHRNPWRWLSLLALLALVLSACGGQTPAAATAQPTAESVAQPTAAPATSAPATAAPATAAPATTAPTTAPEPTEAAAGFQVEQLRLALVGDEGTLNPYTYVTGFPGWNLLMLQYDSLFQVDVNGVPQPWLVQDYEVSADGLTYTFDLHEGVTWHDGQPLTANDVAFAFQYYLDHSHPRWTRALNGVTAIEAESDTQVVLTRATADPSFLLRSLTDLPIIPEHVWAEVADPATFTFEGGNIGSGPYRLIEYQPDQFYRFEANADYFAGPPQVAELQLVEFADNTGTLAALRTNEVDMILQPVAPEQVELLESIEGIDVQQGPEFTSDALYFDTQQPPFDQLPVRQAIALAIDRQDIVDTVYLGAATVGSAGWIHPSSPAANPAVTTEYDPARAASLLDEAGFTDTNGDGIREFDGTAMTFEVLVNSTDSLALRSAELIREMLLEIGIDPQVVSVEETTWAEAVWPGFDNNNGRNYQMAMWGWSAPVQLDPARTTTLIHSDPALAPLNLTGFASEQADELSEQLTASSDPAERAELLNEIQVLIAEEVPFVTLLYADGAYAYWSTVYADWAFIAGQGVVNKLSFLAPEARP